MTTDKIKRYPRQLPPNGLTTAANSIPIAIATDQFPLPITGTVTSTPGPVQFVLDSVDTEVEQDTGTPANNIPLPVALINGQGGSPYQAATETTLGLINGKLVTESLNFGAATGGVRVAAILGNATAVADFGSGALSAQTLRVVLATDQPVITISGTVAATQSGTWNINDVSGTVSLPTGASTEAKQDTGNASLSSLDTKAVQQALNYGAATGAFRVAAQIGNASAAADFNAGTSGAQTLRVSANMTRNGTELSYSSGNTDSNTQRVILATDQPAVSTLQQNSIMNLAYDYFSVVYNSDNDVYTYKTGGSGGTTVATVTITYTSSAKTSILSAART